MLPLTSGEFRAVNDPELRFTPSGMAICSLRVAANSRKKTEAGEWVDDKVCFLRVTAFKKLAENVAESVAKGDLILVSGRLQTEEWEKDGEKKQAYTILADTVGPSIAFKPARFLAADRPAATATSGDTPAAADPWATPPQGDEPPF